MNWVEIMARRLHLLEIEKNAKSCIEAQDEKQNEEQEAELQKEESHV